MPSPLAPPPRPKPLSDVAKRGFDIAMSGLLIVAVIPLLLIIALAVVIESGGPVLHRQRRLGKARRPFTMLKFRSMHPDAEELLAADEELYHRFVSHGFKLPRGEDPRITRVGAVLRAMSLDELPQLVNVLRGDMSIVGPRPPIVEQIPVLYGDFEEHYFAVRPGLTGLWQVSGRSNLSGEQRCALDVEYVTTRSLRADVRIMLATVGAVARRDGAC